MTAAVRMLRTKCIEGITANPDRLRDFVQRSVGIVTALATGRGVYELALEQGLLTTQRQQSDGASRPAVD